MKAITKEQLVTLKEGGSLSISSFFLVVVKWSFDEKANRNRNIF
jgi:hypothetical protein